MAHWMSWLGIAVIGLLVNAAVFAGERRVPMALLNLGLAIGLAASRHMLPALHIPRMPVWAPWAFIGLCVALSVGSVIAAVRGRKA